MVKNDNLTTRQRTSSIIALNVVSLFAQIGQFGLFVTLVPIALEAHQATPEHIGFTSAIFWSGMVIGLLVTGKLTRWLGYRNTVVLGLIISAISFSLLPTIHWRWWWLPSAAVGFGIGLRWIANETWLYQLAPVSARGRIVGTHETLIALASVIGPLMIVAMGASNANTFWLGAALLLIAIAPLYLAATLPATSLDAIQIHQRAAGKVHSSIWLKITSLIGFGGLIAGLGGWLESSIVALLPVYLTDMKFDASNAAWLFTLLGIGAMVCQFPIGWFADHKGVLWTAKACALIAIVSIVLVLNFSVYFPTLAIVIFLLGGISAGLLTLDLVWAAQHGQGAAMTNKVRQVSIIYTSLSAVGPFVSGYIVSQSTSASLFWQQLVIILILTTVLNRSVADD